MPDSLLNSVWVLLLVVVPETLREGRPPLSTPEMEDPRRPELSTSVRPGWALFKGSWFLNAAEVPPERPALPDP